MTRDEAIEILEDMVNKTDIRTMSLRAEALKLISDGLSKPEVSVEEIRKIISTSTLATCYCDSSDEIESASEELAQALKDKYEVMER